MDRKFAAAAANWKLEQKYETLGPRTLTKRNKRARKESNRLPIKTPNGSIVHVAPALESDTDSDDDDPRDKAREEAPAVEGAQEEETAQPERPKIPERRRVVEAKEELAKIATAVQEDPEENVRLFNLYHHSTTVRGACCVGGV